ncbi:hypothetical protein, partial [Bacillus thuringiensis]|uniref:hypothetical protein n=1 Tax=Bacillus thuringiensis TaxID=1428 RepID=UPI0011A740A0
MMKILKEEGGDGKIGWFVGWGGINKGIMEECVDGDMERGGENELGVKMGNYIKRDGKESVVRFIDF